MRRGSAKIDRRAVLAGAPALLLSSCGRRRDADTLLLWAMSYQGDYAPLLMPAFTAATGIHVEVQSIPWTAAHEKLLTAHAGGALPDVLMLPNGWIGEFQMIGALAQVPSRTLTAGLFPGLAEASRVGGQDFAVPWSVAPQVQYFRRDILLDAGYDTPPDTWEGWRAMAQAIKRRRPDDHVFLMLLNWPGALFTMFSQMGANLLRDRETRGNFNTPEARTCLDYYASLFRDGFAPQALSTEVQDPLAAFAGGLFSVWCSGPTTLLDFRRRHGEIAPHRWGTARVAGPRGPGPTSEKDVSLCVSAASPRQREAWLLVRHLTSAENETRFAHLIGSLPAREDAWPALGFPQDVLRPFAAQARDPAETPLIIEWERIQLEVQLIAERVVRGLVPIGEALVEADGRVDRILAKRRSLIEAGRIA